jgi:hypothetical protein
MKVKLVERLKCIVIERTLQQISAINWFYEYSYRDCDIDLKRKFVSKDLRTKS